MRDRLGQLKKERNTLRDRLHQAIEEAKDNVNYSIVRMKRLKNLRQLSKVVEKTSLHVWKTLSIVLSQLISTKMMKKI